MIQLYRAGNTAFKLDSRNPSGLRMVTKAQLDRRAMEQDAVSVDLMSVSPCEFNYRDYLIVDGRPYFLNVLPKVTKDDKRRLTTELTFEGGMYELGRVAFTMAGLHGWDYTGQLYDFANLIINEMNRNSLVVKDSNNRVYHYMGYAIGGYYYWKNVNASDTENYFTLHPVPSEGDQIWPSEMSPGQEIPRITEVGGVWTLDFELDPVKPIQTDEKLLTYDNHTCLAVLHDLVAQWDEWEFAVEVVTADICNLNLSVATQCGGKIILRRKATGISISGVNTNHTNMAYGKKGGLSKITRETADGQNMPSRIYFYGGTQNLPTTYRNTRLCMTGLSKEQSYMDTGLTDNEPCEAVKVFDDIYPASQPFVLPTVVGNNGTMTNDKKHFVITMPIAKFFDIFAKWKPNDGSPYQYGSYQEWLMTYGTGNSNTDLQRYLTYYYGNGDVQGFPKSCYLVSDHVTITFQTGDLAGHTFTITDFETLGEDNEYEITLKCEVDEGLPNTEDPMTFPNGDIMCKAGDKFIVEGCLMPASYVYGNFGSGDYAAETLLVTAARDYLDALASKVKVGVEISQDYIDQHHAVFRLYDGLQITDTDLDFSSASFQVRQLTYDLLKGSYKVEIDDGKGISPWAAVAQYFKKIKAMR